MRWLKLLCKKAAWEVLPLPVIQLIKKQYYFKMLRRWRPENEPDLKVVRHLVKLGDHVIDIGANIGIYTKALSELVGKEGRVYSIEPFPTTFQILCSNINKLHLENVEPLNVAISDSEGVLTMEIPRDHSGAESHYLAHIICNGMATNKAETAKVRASTIDFILGRFPEKITFIKCDVEGHELTCLKGAQKFLTQSQPAWLIEVSGDPDDVNSPAHHVFEILLNKGYTAWWFDCTALKRRHGGDKSVNYFFLTNHHINILKEKEPNLLLTPDPVQKKL
jgi:FkbM family methyltransferase